jgi:hypothetical protein
MSRNQRDKTEPERLLEKRSKLMASISSTTASTIASATESLMSTGEELDSSEIIKEYEVGTGDYIELTPKNWKRLRLRAKHTLEINEFVPKTERGLTKGCRGTNHDYQEGRYPPWCQYPRGTSTSEL